MKDNNKTLPSMKAVDHKPTLDPTEMMLAIELRKWLKGGFTKERIVKVLAMVREDNL